VRCTRANRHKRRQRRRKIPQKRSTFSTTAVVAPKQVGTCKRKTMERLDQIGMIGNNLKTSSKKAVKALHKLVFEQEGDRGNRKRLREFQGFPFAIDSDEYKVKVAYAEANFSWADLVAVCNVLAIEYAGTKKELTQRICSSLSDLNMLGDAEESDREESSEDGSATNEEPGEDEERLRRKGRVISKDVRRRKKNKEAIIKQNEEEEENETEESEDEDGEQATKADFGMSNTRFTMTFRDVEDSIRQYNGDDKYPVERWIMDIEESAELFNWTEMQKLIFAKKSLTGLAKLFIQGERGVTSWKKLKEALKDEFSQKMNSAELHRLLSKRRIKKDESVQAYFLVLKEIASRGEIEDEALYQYVIDGIDDTPVNKNILYGARNTREFKEKLKIYATMKTKTPVYSKTTNTAAGKKMKVKEKEEVRCYNCGALGHRSTECESKSKGMKCFNCNEFGHKASDCKK